jgi:hexosaminidase
MSHRVIPAPFRVETGSGEFRFRSGIRVEYADAALRPIVERFCREVSRRTGLQFEAKMPEGETGTDDAPSIRIDVADHSDLAALPPTIGVSPIADVIPDERYSLTVSGDGVEVRAREPAGVARGLTTLLQLLATTPGQADGAVSVPEQRILDVPRFAWRSFSLDVARRFFTIREVKRLIDLLALYKVNVLNLHFTDDQGWRLPFGRPANGQDPVDPNDPFYSRDDVRELAGYAAERFVTLVPEVDAPGHATAIMKLRPELLSGRNSLDFEPVPGMQHHSSWFDPELPATYELLESVWSDLASAFPSAFINIGGDEPFGMPHELYVPFVRHALPFVRSLGKRTVGWQESIRAGADPGHVIQHWITIPSSADASSDSHLNLSPELMKNVARTREDVETAAANSVPIIVSPHRLAYWDVPYAEPSADPAQEERRQRAGLRLHQPRTVADAFDWEPGTLLGPGIGPEELAGVGSAIWTETVSDFDDLTFLVLPRLAGNAHKAWGEPRPGDWESHRDALATHGRLWEQDGLMYFRSSLIPWA